MAAINASHLLTRSLAGSFRVRFAAWLPAIHGLLWFFVVGLFLPFANPARADIYRYVDEDGVIHFTNVPTNCRYGLYVRTTKLDYKSYFDRYDHIIRDASRKNGVDSLLVKAIIRAESDFDRYAVSRAGAQGLMQLMPETAKELSVNDCFNPGENIHAGVRYLKRQLKNFRNDVPLALAAYNAGENAVRRYGRIPPYEETKTFVARVLRYWDEFNLHKRK